MPKHNQLTTGTLAISMAGIAAGIALGACSTTAVLTGRQQLLTPCEIPGAEDDAKIEARCGVVTVPEDPSAPAGRSIDLRVLVIPATGENRAEDPIFYFEGGPGGGSVDTARVIAEYILPQATARQRRRDSAPRQPRSWPTRGTSSSRKTDTTLASHGPIAPSSWSPASTRS